MIFITHKLPEIMAVTDRVTVLRRGKVVATRPTPETAPQELARLMVGEELPPPRRRSPRPPGKEVLRVEGLVVKDPEGREVVKGVSFSLREGEILGIAGVQGNGQTELVEALVGLRRWEGEAELSGRSLRGLGPAEIRDLGLAHIPEDRHGMGLVLDFTVAENAVLGWLKPFLSPLRSIRWRRVYRFVAELIRRFSIQAPGPRVPVRYLSGGNQQRLVVGRELSKEPVVLIANQPTRGLDVAATRYIRDLLVELRDRGLAILLVSADLDEVLELSDRVAVMYRGSFAGVLEGEEIERERIGLLMAGVEVGG